MARKEFVAGKAAGKQEGYTSTHFTPETAVIDLLKLIPFESGDVALDPSAGVNKVWFNNFPCQKEYCEIEEGTNFFEYAGKCDWIVGNPPFTDFVRYLMHSPNIARKGFAYLIGHSRINQVTPRRLSILENQGFHLSKLHVLTIKKWFGRYYFLVFSRSKNEGIGYYTENYSDEPLRRRTPHALDGRESAPSQAVSSPEVLSPLQAVSSPALPQVM